MEHIIRPIRPEEWRQVRELRLAALADPAAPIAFLDDHPAAAARPDAHWQERAADAAEGGPHRQFIAEAPDGSWDGSVTVLIEEPGDPAVFGGVPEHRQAHLVGVFVRPGQRGSGVAEALFEAAVDWARSVDGVRRIRLYVHERNARAEAFYRRFGFVRTGPGTPMATDPSALEHEMELPR
ncbi:GNAT family N-acetyltransferase [Phaeacidiphilus oryzae]|jgi:ribosomal protein S18 acetylase RimI-like enzyme|uniref:GNAT family N-acetyltransferase n=1 Tax=Phaeacidiphilus oryzae TaxID=348818 RepID=UPI00055B6EDB|nr:GNAT family N-acetyltransferase [Phaeacidiphilus oryzae]